MSHEPDIAIALDFDGSSLVRRWRPFSVYPITGEIEGLDTVGDLAMLGTIHVFSERAVGVMGDLLSANGELLPLTYAGEEGRCFAYNVTTVIDALDTDRSTTVRFDDGRIMIVERYVFRPTQLAGASVFKIPQLSAPVFVTDTFVDRLSGSSLKGFAPEEVWSSK